MWDSQLERHSASIKLQMCNRILLRPTLLGWNIWAEDKVIQILPVKTFERCHFSSALPSCLSALLCTFQTLRTLWSSCEKLLKIQKYDLKSFGEYLFSFITAWMLPASLWYLPTVWVQDPAEDFSLDRPFHKLNQMVPVTIGYAYVYVYKYVWKVCAITLSFCFAKSFELCKSYALLLLRLSLLWLL